MNTLDSGNVDSVKQGNINVGNVKDQSKKTIEKNENDTNEKENLNHDEIEDILKSVETNMTDENSESTKKRRGRPKKIQSEENNLASETKRKRGRPKKVQITDKNNIEENKETNQEEVNLFSLASENDENDNGGLILPGLESDNTDNESMSQNEEVNLFDLSNDEDLSSKGDIKNNYQESEINYKAKENNFDNINQENKIEEVNQFNQVGNTGLENLLSMSNKLVAFVGTSKNGTSFLVNSMAEILSKKGIKTAILDLTQNKNSYYVYTKNDETLRNIAYSCMESLENGIVRGIDIDKNLTVFTTLPDNNTNLKNCEKILTTLMQNYSLVIMDCDYETSYSYFKYAQEIYLVQSYDILTIQPLTAFLRNLKAKDILDPNKLRIVLNKVLRVRSITDRVIIGGMSSYNDPSMSYMTELFDKDSIKYCTIPFDQEAYSRYLDGLVNCEISTKGYPKNIMASLEKLGNMIYPLLNNDKPANKFNTYNQKTSRFPSNMNETLNKMKNRY